jgi:uncharacterized protein (DUF885 family)
VDQATKHAYGMRWSRERAIQFMLDNVGLPENEVDRYIVWPSQALAYKMGQRHLEGLRRQAEERLDGQFDLRAFHDELLRHGDSANDSDIRHREMDRRPA